MLKEANDKLLYKPPAPPRRSSRRRRVGGEQQEDDTADDEQAEAEAEPPRLLTHADVLDNTFKLLSSWG